MKPTSTTDCTEYSVPCRIQMKLRLFKSKGCSWSFISSFCSPHFPFLCLTGCSNTTEVLCKQCQCPGIKFHQWARSAVSPLLQVGWETSLCLHLSGWNVLSLFLCVHEIWDFAAMWVKLKFGLIVFLVPFGLVRVCVVSVLASDCPTPGCCIPVWVCASSCHSWSLDYPVSQWQN